MARIHERLPEIEFSKTVFKPSNTVEIIIPLSLGLLRRFDFCHFNIVDILPRCVEVPSSQY